MFESYESCISTVASELGDHGAPTGQPSPAPTHDQGNDDNGGSSSEGDDDSFDWPECVSDCSLCMEDGDWECADDCKSGR